MTHSHLPTNIADTRTTVDLPCDEKLWEASPLEEWSARAANTVSQGLNAARASYQSASVNEYSFFQHQIINAHADANLRCLEELTSPPQKGAPSNTRFNYHVFQMAKYMPLRSLLIVVGESWFLGRKIEQEADFEQAKLQVREWITRARSSTPSKQVANSLRAHWHALKVLRMVVGSTDASHVFQSTNMLHEDWAVYLAVLVCWAHGYGRTHPSDQTAARTEATPSHTPQISSRKRKNTEVATPARKRQAMMQTITSSGMLAPSVAAYTTQIPSSTSNSAYSEATWSAYGPLTTYATPQWSTPSYYDPTLMTYGSQTDLGTTSAPETSAYSSSVAAARTATNTPPSRSSRATTIQPTSAPVAEGSISELRTYLSLTEAPAPQFLATLDVAVLTRTKNILDAVRSHKFGGKRTVGGLMNNAERILSRLAEERNADMF